MGGAVTKKKRGSAKLPDTTVGESAGEAPPSPPAPAGSAPSTPPTERNQLGRWVKGQSGNPAGKPKGLKSFITKERMAMEAALRSYISGDKGMNAVLDGIDRVFDIMKNGEDREAIAAFKLISDKLLTSPKDSDQGGHETPQLQVIITRAQGGDDQPVQVIESTAEEINE